MLKSKFTIPAFLILLILLAYLPFYIHGGFIGDFGDPIGQTIPNKFLLTQYLKNGLFPLWNPLSFLGIPFLADIQVGTFYFPDLAIFSLFNPFTALNISILFHMILGALGCFFLLKNFTKSDLTALIGSLILALSGAFLTRLFFLNFLETISLIPWILLAIQSGKHLVTKVSLLFALMIFAGHPIAALYGTIIIIIFSAFQHFKNKKTLLKIGAAIILGLLISSIQLIPFYTLKTQSVRDEITYGDFASGGITKNTAISVLNPFHSDFQYSVDLYFHFGTIALLLLMISPFFYKKLSPTNKKLYKIGATLILAGLLFSLGDRFPQFYKILYEIPPFNLARIPARYLAITHFGIVFAIAALLSHILIKRKKIGLILSLLIILNTMFLPSLLLKRHEIQDAQTQYSPEIKTTIEQLTTDRFTLFDIPKYFLSDGPVIFPNRHVLNLMPNFIGYNPLILKTFHSQFPVDPIGAFKNPDYLKQLDEKFTRYGLKYYIFSTDSKSIPLLHNYTIWQNPNPTPFAYFKNPQNKIENIQFEPGKIKITTSMATPDNLIINQNYYPGWEMNTSKKITPAEIYEDLVQSYPIKTPTKTIQLNFKPKDVLYGLYGSLLGLLILLFLNLKPFKKPST